MIAVTYLMKSKIEKIYFEVISNTKILYKILLNEVANYQDFAKLTGVVDKGEMDSVEYGNWIYRSIELIISRSFILLLPRPAFHLPASEF